MRLSRLAAEEEARLKLATGPAAVPVDALRAAYDAYTEALSRLDALALSTA